MNTFIIDFFNELWVLVLEMSPYLILGFIIAGFLSATISSKVVEDNLGGSGISPIVKASIFGIPLPLCSCGVIPVATSLYKHGASRGATTSFLISTPQTGVDSVLVTYSLLGPIFTIFRPIVALITGVVGGFWVETAVKESHNTSQLPSEVLDKNKSKFRQIIEYGFVSLPQDIGKPLIVGIVIASVISMVVPDDFFASYFGNSFFSLVITMFAGIPIYVCATASVPIALALIVKGVSPGAAFVFLMTGPATNAATISTIWKVLGKKTASIYLATVAICSLIAGVILNSFSSDINAYIHHHNHWMMPIWIQQLSGIFLIAIIFFALFKLYFPSMFRLESTLRADVELNVKGMTCNHCIKTVKAAVFESSPNVKDVNINLSTGSVMIEGNSLDKEIIAQAIIESGFKIN